MEIEIVDNLNDLTIDQYIKYIDICANDENLDQTEMTVRLISLLTNKSEEEIFEYTMDSFNRLSEHVEKLLGTVLPIDAVVEFKLEGFNFVLKDFNNLKVSEFIDLEEFSKEPFKNMKNIFAILYDNDILDYNERLKIFDKLTIGLVYGTLLSFMIGAKLV